VFLKMEEVAKIFWLLYFTVKVVYQFWQKLGWATFWAIFLTFFYIFYIFFIWSPCPKGFPAKEEKDCRINTHSKSFLLELFFHW
jgi:hypothetical protein